MWRGEGQRDKSGKSRDKYGTSCVPYGGVWIQELLSPAAEVIRGRPAPAAVPRYPSASCTCAARLRQPHHSLYISAKFELMIGTVFVILHQAALVSGIYLCYCFGSFFQGLLSSDMSGLQSKRNSEFTFTVRQAECYYPCICHQPADPSL